MEQQLLNFSVASEFIVLFLFFCHQSCLIQELETRIQKLSQDAEAGTKLRTQLEREKMEMEGKITQLTAELNSTKEKSVTILKSIFFPQSLISCGMILPYDYKWR